MKTHPAQASIIGILAACFLGLLAPPAYAHLMPSRQATLNVVDSSVFAVVSVPVSSLHGFDDNGDGLLSMPELTAHQTALRAEIDERFTLSDGETAAETVLVDLVLSPEHESSQDRAGHLIALKHARFPAPPTALRLGSDLFGGEDRQLVVTATRTRGSGKETDVAILTPDAAEHGFFRPAAADLAGMAPRALGGIGRVALLLTIIAAALGWLIIGSRWLVQRSA